MLSTIPPICVFFFNDTATTEIYTVSDTLSLHDALPIAARQHGRGEEPWSASGSCAARSEEHTSELQSPDTISYAVFCLKKKKKHHQIDFMRIECLFIALLISRKAN